MTPEAHIAGYFTRLSLHSPRCPLDRGPGWTCPLPPGIMSSEAAEQGLGFLRAVGVVSLATTQELVFRAGGGSLPVQQERQKSPQPGSQCREEARGDEAGSEEEAGGMETEEGI